MASHDGEPFDDTGSIQSIGRNVVRVIVETLVGPYDRGEGGPGGWWFASERTYRFRAPPKSRREEEGTIETVTPRAAGWWRDRLPVLPDAGVIDKNPDWVCEVEDPWNSYSRALKLHELAGVSHAWTIDPVARTLAVYTRRRASWSLPEVYNAEARVRIPPFDALEIDVSAFWKPQ